MDRRTGVGYACNASRETGSVEEVDKVYVICQAGFQNLDCPHHSHALHCICFPLVT